MATTKKPKKSYYLHLTHRNSGHVQAIMMASKRQLDAAYDAVSTFLVNDHQECISFPSAEGMNTIRVADYSGVSTLSLQPIIWTGQPDE